MRRIRSGLVRLGVVVALLLGASAHAGQGLRPLPGFRFTLTESAIAADTAPERARSLKGLTEQGGGAWPSKGATGRAELSLTLTKEQARQPLLMVLLIERVANGDPNLRVEVASRPGRRTRAIAHEVFGEPCWRRVYIEVPKGRRLLKVIVGAAASGPKLVPRIHDVALLHLDPRGRNDYWLFLGASLTEHGIDPVAFAKRLGERYEGFSPYVVNEAVSGWGARTLHEKLPEILARHPHARYVAIHIGGTNVSHGRPYPGDSGLLSGKLEAILQLVVAHHKIPILARLSYRAYKAKDGKPAVPPEENGSGPYVERVYDPLIARYCPAFFDRRQGRGKVDLYGYFHEHPEELSDGGVLPNSKGYESWARLWCEQAGAAVYAEE